MKAIPKPTERLTKDERKQLVSRVWADLSKIHRAKKMTMADRIIVFAVIACRDEYNLGEKRVRRLYDHLNMEMDRQIENMNDTGDAILFDNLHTIGLDDLAKKIVEDYKNEQIALRGTIFDREANDA